MLEQLAYYYFNKIKRVPPADSREERELCLLTTSLESPLIEPPEVGSSLIEPPEVDSKGCCSYFRDILF